MTVPYPVGLRPALSIGKSRTQPGAFTMSDPRRGYGYAQASGTDTPVFWDAKFRFSTTEAQQFVLWFRNTLQRGVLEFTMPIKTEFGLITHTCRFLPDSLMPTSQNGGIWEYSATIMSRDMVIPESFEEASALIVGTPDWYGFAGVLDSTVTSAIPGP